MDWSGCYLTLEKRLFLVTADQKQQLPATWCISNCNHRLDESDMTSNALRVIKDVSQSKGEKSANKMRTREFGRVDAVYRVGRKEEQEEIRAGRRGDGGGEDLTWLVPRNLCAKMSESAKAYAHLVPHCSTPTLLISTHVLWALVHFTEMALLFVSSVYLCAQVYMCITENIREGWVSCGRQSHLCMCVCVCVSACLCV